MTALLLSWLDAPCYFRNGQSDESKFDIVKQFQFLSESKRWDYLSLRFFLWKAFEVTDEGRNASDTKRTKMGKNCKYTNSGESVSKASRSVSNGNRLGLT